MMAEPAGSTQAQDLGQPVLVCVADEFPHAPHAGHTSRRTGSRPPNGGRGRTRPVRRVPYPFGAGARSIPGSGRPAQSWMFGVLVSRCAKPAAVQDPGCHWLGARQDVWAGTPVVQRHRAGRRLEAESVGLVFGTRMLGADLSVRRVVVLARPG